MPLMLRYSVTLSLVGCMASDPKYSQIALEVHKLTTSTKVTILGVSCHHCETGYNGKHNHINSELYLHFFQMDIGMPMVVTTTMTSEVTDVIGFTVLSCSSLNGSNESIVKINYCGVVQGCATA